MVQIEQLRRSKKSPADTPAVSDTLRLLCDFLNANLNFQQDPKPGEPLTLCFHTHMGIDFLQSVETKHDALKVQKEIISDLQSLHPQALITKLNNLNLIRHEVLTPKNYRFLHTKKPSERVVTVQNQRYVVGISHFNNESLHKRIYSYLFQIVTCGELPHLKHCHRCNKYFGAGHLNERYCSECKKENSRQKGSARQKTRRVKDSLSAEKERRLANEKKFAQDFCQVLSIAGGPTGQHTSIAKFMKSIGKWNSLKGWEVAAPWINEYKRGLLAETIWENRSPEEKTLIRRALESNGQT